ncbi:MAG: hypothetical protein R2758_02480 [Bacteroidales bacterium]
MYTIAGTGVPKEKELDLAGYLGNKPVHLGNNAFNQEQNDIYGQVLASLLPSILTGGSTICHTRSRGK